MNVTDEDEEEIVDELVEFWINNKKDGNVSEWEGKTKKLKDNISERSREVLREKAVAVVQEFRNMEIWSSWNHFEKTAETFVWKIFFI